MESKKSYRVALWRGLKKRCPRCGVGPIFARWYTVHEACPSCGLDLVTSQSNTWAFMYISTAAMTGVIVLIMLLVEPPNILLARVLVFLGSLALILLSLPYRKGFAIAMEYLIDLRWGVAHRLPHAPLNNVEMMDDVADQAVGDRAH